jgi:hypothetical protein
VTFPIVIFCLVVGLCWSAVGEEEKKGVFPDLKAKEEFAVEVSTLIEKAWKQWQDSILIDDIEVEGSYGLLSPGDMGKAVLTMSDMLENFEREARSQDYINCVKAVTGSVANGMRLWQRGYRHENILFPRGASCTFTLPPCDNVPVKVASGSSSGETEMAEAALYNYMLFRAPRYEDDMLEVFHASARAISECFEKWENSCSIIGIVASGGIAPQPAPMGTGPGPVRGAKGNNGKLVGPYFDGKLMKDIMVAYFREQEKP